MNHKKLSLVYSNFEYAEGINFKNSLKIVDETIYTGSTKVPLSKSITWFWHYFP